jgi:hypothetical protein
MSKYRAEQTLCLSGWESGTEIEITQVVTYSVTKYSPATLEQPEEPATVEDIECRYFLDKVEMQIGSLIAGKFEEDDGFKDWLMSEAADTDEYHRDCAAEARREDARYAD